jgi:hypothetical protein
MSRVIRTGKPPEKPLFGISRGSLIPIGGMHEMSSAARAYAKSKEISKHNRATEGDPCVDRPMSVPGQD